MLQQAMFVHQDSLRVSHPYGLNKIKNVEITGVVWDFS